MSLLTLFTNASLIMGAGEGDPSITSISEPASTTPEELRMHAMTTSENSARHLLNSGETATMPGRECMKAPTGIIMIAPI